MTWISWNLHGIEKFDAKNQDHYTLLSFQTGKTLFLEGDDTQDVYFLVSGKLAILKGRKRIAELSDEGSVFGEMSFLLGEKRTATVKAV